MNFKPFDPHDLDNLTTVSPCGHGLGNKMDTFIQSYYTYSGFLYQVGDTVIYDGKSWSIDSILFTKNGRPIATLTNKDSKIQVNLHDLNK